MQQRMEQIRKEIAADPYTALFGRRLPPLDFPSNIEKRIVSACRSVFGMGKAGETDKTTHVTQTKSVQDLEYDPIRNRMVPRKSAEQTNGTGSRESPDTLVGNSTRYENRVGYLSAVDRSKVHSTETNESASAPQDSESVKENQPDPSIILGQAHPESGEATPNDSPRRQNSLESPTLKVESHGKDMKELDSDHGTQANVPDSQNCSRSPGHHPDHYKPPSSSFLDPAQQQELRMKEERAEDLDLLRASDIRSLYIARNLKGEQEARRKTRKDLDTAFDSYVDPLSDVRAQDVRARFQEPVPTSSANGTTRNEPAAQESTTQLHPEKDRPPNNSQVPVEEEHTDTLLPGKQAHKNTQTTADGSLIGDTYRVLAYDPLTLQITQAETNSSFHTTHECLHPSEILPRLNNPSKFLPYFKEMQTDGYEIVSGGGDILVFRKALTEKAKSELGAYVRDEPLFSDEALRPSNTANTASPASVPSYSETNIPPRTSGSRARKILRRVVISGFATVATCYALGVVCEYFRTGGQDGRGIDGFTEFESERRHRD